jgi:nitrate reductase NapAB chaperone NapD
MERVIFDSKQSDKSMISLIKKQAYLEDVLKVTMVYRNLNIQFPTNQTGIL